MLSGAFFGAMKSYITSSIFLFDSHDVHHTIFSIWFFLFSSKCYLIDLILSLFSHVRNNWAKFLTLEEA